MKQLKEVSNANVVAALQKIQEQKGFISKDDIIQLSQELAIPCVDLYGVATFYSQFKLIQPGKNILSLCRGTACHVKKSGELLDYMQELLKIKPGETTSDGKITLELVNCIGACAKAPAMMINGDAHGDLDKKKIKKLISELA